MVVSYWKPGDPRRAAEIDECLRRNLANPDIDEVVLLVDPGVSAPFVDHKLCVLESSRPRPRVAELVARANDLITGPHDMTILANSDCYFDGLEKLKVLGDTRQFVFAMTRTDVEWNGEPVAGYDPWFTGQDAWVFTGRIRPLKWTDFSLGNMSCDWVLAWVLHHAGYMLVNPFHDLRLSHLHLSQHRVREGNVRPPAGLGIGTLREVVPKTLSSIHFPDRCQTGIIAYSLYGSGEMYTHGAIMNAEMCRFIYPGFIPRFYVDFTVPHAVKCRLFELGSELVERPKSQGASGMLWRLEALAESGVDFVLIRDADSRLSRRDRWFFDQWVESGLPWHLVRDHPHHKNEVILSMFNSRKPIAVPALPYALEQPYNIDERFFAAEVVPLLAEGLAVHDSCDSGPMLPGEVRLPCAAHSDDWFYFAGAKIWPDGGIDPGVASLLV